MYPQRSTTNSSRASSRRKHLPFRLGAAFIFALILAGCVLPTADISGRQVLPAASVRKAIEGILTNPPKTHHYVIHMMDSGYFVYTRNELLACLGTCGWIAEQKYLWDLWDCEEFAFETMLWVRSQLPGVAFGSAFRPTGGPRCHSDNLFVDQSLNVWVVDVRRYGSELRPAASSFYSLVLI